MPINPFISATAVAMAFSITSQTLAQWTVTSLHPAGSSQSSASAIGSSGIAGSTGTLAVSRAALWTGPSSNTYIDLHPSAASGSAGLGTGGGQVVGRASLSGLSQAFLWSTPGGPGASLAPPSGPGQGPALSEASATNGNQQVGWARVRGYDRASLWSSTASSWTDLHLYGPGGIDEEGDASYAYGIAGNQQVGSVRQYTFTDGATHAALWSGTASSFVDLHPAGASASEALALSGGQQVGYGFFNLAGNIVSRAALWTGSATSFIDLTPVGGFQSIARGAFNGFQVGEVDGRAAIWNSSPESYFDLSSVLSVPGAPSQATGVWSDGTTLFVSGSALGEAVVWRTVIPGPSSVALLAVGSVMTCARRRRANAV